MHYVTVACNHTIACICSHWITSVLLQDSCSACAKISSTYTPGQVRHIVVLPARSCMRCRSLSLACIVQLQPRSVRQTVQLPLLVARSMTHVRTAHCCLAVAMCLVAACSALDRHKPHPRPSPSGDDCPVCTGDENVPHSGHFEYYILAKYVSHPTLNHSSQALVSG